MSERDDLLGVIGHLEDALKDMKLSGFDQLNAGIMDMSPLQQHTATYEELIIILINGIADYIERDKYIEGYESYCTSILEGPDGMYKKVIDFDGWVELQKKAGK